MTDHHANPPRGTGPQGPARNRWWADMVVLLFAGMFLYGLAKVGREWRAPQRAAIALDLSLARLPLYTFYSLCRGLAAFALSLLFTLVYGYTAARVRFAD